MYFSDNSFSLSAVYSWIRRASHLVRSDSSDTSWMKRVRSWGKDRASRSERRERVVAVMADCVSDWDLDWSSRRAEAEEGRAVSTAALGESMVSPSLYWVALAADS